MTILLIRAVCTVCIVLYCIPTTISLDSRLVVVVIVVVATRIRKSDRLLGILDSCSAHLFHIRLLNSNAYIAHDY
jgi:hypothetical protein